jgi:hypothetical protein
LKRQSDLILFSAIGVVALAVFGKFGFDLVGVMKERNRRTNWTYDYKSTVEKKDQWTYHPPDPKPSE